MPDITFDDLLKTQKANTPDTGLDMSGDALMEYGKLALGILEQFNLAKGQTTIPSRPAEQQTQQNTEVQKPMVDVTQIKEALETVKTLKGDITISSILKLLEENKEAVAGMLKEL